MSTSIERRVDAAYKATHERLAGQPEYERLKAAAEDENRGWPHVWIDRNRFALYVELAMPSA